jgi:hypothetical protein
MRGVETFKNIHVGSIPFEKIFHKPEPPEDAIFQVLLSAVLTET